MQKLKYVREWHRFILDKLGFGPKLILLGVAMAIFILFYDHFVTALLPFLNICPSQETKHLCQEGVEPTVAQQTVGFFLKLSNFAGGFAAAIVVAAGIFFTLFDLARRLGDYLYRRFIRKRA